MKSEDKIVWTGKIKIKVLGLDGSVKEVIDLTNKITGAARNMLRDALRGSVTDCKIKYLAWGSDNTAPADSDVALGAEFGRKQITSYDYDDYGIEITTTYMAPYEGVEAAIEELGWLAGANATATPGSGILVARVLYSRAKTNLESLQIERTDTLSEVV